MHYIYGKEEDSNTAYGMYYSSVGEENIIIFRNMKLSDAVRTFDKIYPPEEYPDDDLIICRYNFGVDFSD
jgi:hypothetical protein